MKDIVLIVDSTVYLPDSYLKEHNIKVVSLNVIENDQTYKELEIDNNFVFSKMNQKIRLTTSQPSPSEFVETYEACLTEGYKNILVLPLSQGLSGTYQSAILAKNMMKDPSKIHVFDALNAAYGNEFLAMQIIEMIEQGKERKEIIKQMDYLIENTQLMFTVENLFFMQKGGRLSMTQALIGSVLRVKPVIRLVDGKLKLHHKERTHKKVYEFFIKEMQSDPQAKANKKLHVRIIGVDSQESAADLEKMVREVYPKAIITLQDYIGPVFSIHVGPRGFGLCWAFV